MPTISSKCWPPLKSVRRPWSKKGVWTRVFEALQDPDLEWVIIDSTVVRAHQHAAGKKGGKVARPSADRGADSARNGVVARRDQVTEAAAPHLTPRDYAATRSLCGIPWWVMMFNARQRMPASVAC